MNQLTYNHTGTQFFETKPNSSMITLMETAKSIVREALPIKCVEGEDTFQLRRQMELKCSLKSRRKGNYLRYSCVRCLCQYCCRLVFLLLLVLCHFSLELSCANIY